MQAGITTQVGVLHDNDCYCGGIALCLPSCISPSMLACIRPETLDVLSTHKQMFWDVMIFELYTKLTVSKLNPHRVALYTEKVHACMIGGILHLFSKSNFHFKVCIVSEKTTVVIQ